MREEDKELETLKLDLTKLLVADIAPQESSSLERIIGLYKKRDRSTRASDDPLAFGGDVFVHYLSVPIFAFASAALPLLMQFFSTTSTELAKQLLKEWISNALNRRAHAQSVRLKPEQLKHLRALAQSEFEKHGLSSKRSLELANALIARLALTE